MNESRNIIHGSFVDILGNLRYAVGTSMDKEEEHTPLKDVSKTLGFIFNNGFHGFHRLTTC